jgi:D-alanyl-D-alanine carboxypeptidase
MNQIKSISNLFIILMWISIIFIGFACEDNSTDPINDPNKVIKEQLQALIDNAVASDNSIHNAVLSVEAPGIGLKWSGASGMSDPQFNIKMDPNDQFRTASVGKMTLATLVLQQVEEGNLKLDDSIYHYLPVNILTGLHVFQGIDYSEQITIRQLLSHTSGLPDYVTDGNKDENGITEFMQLMIDMPEKFWTPEETIEYTKQNLIPFFAPGDGYHYSDTDFQLLGLILQNIKGKALNEIYREKLFGPLGMSCTYMEYYDDPVQSIPGRGLSHIFFGDLDYTSWTSNSADWAGGGLISTTENLNRFIRAFVNNEVFKNSQTKQLMLDCQNIGELGFYYGLGVMKINFEEIGLTGYGQSYGHEGISQSFMFYWEKENVTIVGTLNQANSNYPYQQLILGVMNLLKK